MPRKVKQTSKAPIILIGIGAFLILALLIWLAVTNNPGSSSTTAGQVPYPDITRITLSDAKAAYDQKTAVFLDVRDADSYQAGHIPGAMNIPLTSLESRLNELKTGQWIITYCT
jgi:3-mercaptopyruvate sulfurtransferase SseA